MSEASDRDDINRLIMTYAVEGDRGNTDLLLGAFAPDGALQTSNTRAEGREGIRKMLTGGRTERGGGGGPPAKPLEPGQRRFIRHHITSSLVSFTGPDDAVGRTYFINIQEHGIDHAGLYADKFRRIDGRWYIVFREMRLDWISDARKAISGPLRRAPAEGPITVVTG